jgi:hypothetical protein
VNRAVVSYRPGTTISDHKSPLTTSAAKRAEGLESGAAVRLE